MKSAPKPSTSLTQGFLDEAPWLASCCTFRPMKAWDRPRRMARVTEDPLATQPNCQMQWKTM